MANRMEGDLTVVGTVRADAFAPATSRSSLAQDNNAVFPVPFTDFRVHDALATVLPGTSANDDLGLDGGTFGTSQPTIRTSDLKAAGSVTRYARTQIRLPAEYVAGETVMIRIHGGMITTVADTAATVDVEAYRIDKDNSIGSDLCATAATSINSLTFDDKDFTITASTLSPGDVLDVRIAMLVNDAATGTAVIGAIAGVDLVCDIKG